MSACRKCNNTNVSWNGVWKQCANCGEVHEREGFVENDTITYARSLKEKKSLQDIVPLPLKSTLMGKLISRLRLIS